jgi:hypothetical protein
VIATSKKLYTAGAASQTTKRMPVRAFIFAAKSSLPGDAHHGSLPAANVLPREFKFRVRARQERSRKSRGSNADETRIKDEKIEHEQTERTEEMALLCFLCYLLLTNLTADSAEPRGRANQLVRIYPRVSASSAVMIRFCQGTTVGKTFQGSALCSPFAPILNPRFIRVRSAALIESVTTALQMVIMRAIH